MILKILSILSMLKKNYIGIRLWFLFFVIKIECLTFKPIITTLIFWSKLKNSRL